MGKEKVRIKLLGLERTVELFEEIKNKIKEVESLMEELSNVKIDLEVT